MGAPNKILITGIGGYLGSTLVKYIPESFLVIGYGHDKNFSELKKIRKNNLDLVSGDINDERALASAITDVVTVVHTIATVGNKAATDDPFGAIKTTLRGTRTLANTLNRVYGKDVPQVIHISSQSVYGTFAERPMPLTEEDECAPDDLYGALKAESEFELKNLQALILRPTNLYGYGAGIGFDKNVISKFVKMAQRNEAITLFGDGGQGIDFIHVSDVARAIVKFITERKVKKDIYNIGIGRAIPMKEVAETVQNCTKELLGTSIKIEYKEAPPNKIWPSRWVSIKKIKKDYNWEPERELKESIIELIKKL